MTIASEIQRIKSNIANAYMACENKGATLPVNQNSDNLSLTIENMQASETSRYGLTFDNIWGTIDTNGKLQFPPSGDLVASGIVTVDDYILANKFGGNAYAVTKKRGIKSITFPDLTTVGNAAMYQFCTYTTDLVSVSFPELVNVGQCAMYNAFQNNTALKSASFPKLKILSGMYNSLTNAFYYCQNLEYVNFDSLEQLTKQALSSAFSSCTKLKELSFPSLNENSFGNYTDQFNRMLSYVTGCTVHFPIRIKKTIQNWSDVISGFGGTNTIILFDLHASTINFITSSENINIYIDKDLIEENTVDVPAEDTDYLAHDSSSNIVLFDTVTGLQEDGTKEVTINFTQQSKKISTSIGINGLSVIYTIDGINFNSTSESNGNYTINVIGSNKDINYFVDGGDNYSDASGTINFQNADITQSISLNSATVSTFTRPNLTANGTMGESSFAVSCDSSVSGYYAYSAVNGNTDYLWMVNNTTSICKYTFYNPTPLKVSQIINYYTSTTYSASNFVIEGSNDNSSWVEIGTYTVSKTLTQTIPVNSSRYYKYHRITYKNSTIRLKDLGITATQKG
ncbi:hypothetical protein J6O48_13165 [bacterium]|nr:hypothetical protein [bacterium]